MLKTLTSERVICIVGILRRMAQWYVERGEPGFLEGEPEIVRSASGAALASVDWGVRQELGLEASLTES